MTTLVHTSPEGPAGQQISLLTATTRARSLVQTLDSTLVDNVSLVAGATVTAALNNLSTTIGALNSNQVLNASSVAGVTVTDALQTIDAKAAGIQLAWLAAGGSSNVITALPAGHRAGIYTVGVALLFNVTGGGTANLTIAGTSPIVGATSIVPTGLALTGASTNNHITRTFASDGSAAITCQLAGVGVTGNPSVNIYCGAVLIGKI